MFRFPTAPVSRLTLLSLVLTVLSACSFFRGDGSRQHLEPPPEAPHKPVDSKVKRMLVEVTTDTTGAVVTITFKQSSGSDAVDAYVADSLRGGWPPTPSTRSLVELTYSAARDKRFSEPKVLSTSPAP